jgi:glycosyltransferase involved in cell wall biosynthesis
MDAVIVHSEHGARRLREAVGVDPEKIHVIPHGVFQSAANFSRKADSLPPELSASKDKQVVLLFGLVRPYKGVDILLQAWEQLLKENNPNDIELWIVGMPRMDITALQKSSPTNVSWVPRFVDGEELAATFHHADIAVLPYNQIDQSGVLFTALPFGMPLILSDVGGFPEIAAEGAAELFPAGDSQALGELLNKLLTDQTRRERLRTSALKLSSDDGPFGWSSIAQQTLDLYRSILRA